MVAHTNKTFENDESCKSVDVVIVGGGPTGMLAAAELTLLGLRVTLFESRVNTDLTPRAGTIHARSLSHLARRGYIQSVLPEEINRRAGLLHKTAFQFAGMPGLTVVAPAEEPAPLAGIPQAHLEEVFEQRALMQGADIRRGVTVELIRVDNSQGVVKVCYSDPSAPEPKKTGMVCAQYCIGADGARSLVARSGTFPSVEFPASMNAISARARTVDGIIPAGWNPTNKGWTMRNPGFGQQDRIIGMDFTGPATDRSVPDQREYIELMERVLGFPVELSEITHLTRFSDFSRYRSKTHDGRLLLVGDAAHIHYPLGGQGLNTGMQDVFTLCWRLASVIQGTEPEHCLDEWSQLRVSIASTVIANTMLQAQIMHPDATALRSSMSVLLKVPAIHDGIAEMISGQFQPGFVTDLDIFDKIRGERLSLSQLLRSGRGVELRVNDEAPRVGTRHPDRISVVGAIHPTPPWSSAYISPDGYLSETLP